MARRLLCRQPLRSLRAGCADANLGSDAGLQPRKRRAERRRAASTPPQPDAAGLRPETSALSEQPWSGWTLQEERGPRPLVQRAIYFGLQGDDKCRAVAACPTQTSRLRPKRTHARQGRHARAGCTRFDGRKRGAARRLGRAALARIDPVRPSCLASSLGTVRLRDGPDGLGSPPSHALARTKLIAAAPGYARDD